MREELILALESSCDDSALALFAPDRGILGEWTHRQIDVHRVYGGVVPDLASREHLRNFPFLLERMRELLGNDIPSVTKIAVTTGPGLAGCLAMGISLAHGLSVAWEVPVVGVNHLLGHIYSPWISSHAADPARFREAMESQLPHLGLLVSGGNTLLFRIDSGPVVTLLGETVDDAAGEALDKGAKLLGLPYPGGPQIEELAASGDPTAFRFPRPFADSSEIRFSFSGLKTSLRYLLEKMDDATCVRCLPDLCASYQAAVCDALLAKVRQVLRDTGPYRSLGLSGGVANNRTLRSGMESLAGQDELGLCMALPRHTGDNAAMIAFASWMDPRGCLEPPRLSPSLPLVGSVG